VGGAGWQTPSVFFIFLGRVGQHSRAPPIKLDETGESVSVKKLQHFFDWNKILKQFFIPPPSYSPAVQRRFPNKLPLCSFLQ
jgi:hypothetical protein